MLQLTFRDPNQLFLSFPTPTHPFFSICMSFDSYLSCTTHLHNSIKLYYPIVQLLLHSLSFVFHLVLLALVFIWLSFAIVITSRSDVVGCGYNQLIKEERFINDDPSHVLSYDFKRGIIYCFTIMHDIFKLLACRLTHQPDPLVTLYLIPWVEII